MRLGLAIAAPAAIAVAERSRSRFVNICLTPFCLRDFSQHALKAAMVRIAANRFLACATLIFCGTKQQSEFETTHFAPRLRHFWSVAHMADIPVISSHVLHGMPAFVR